MDERLSLIVNGTDEQTQRVHVAQDAARGFELALGR